MSRARIPVLIAGAGPAGLVAAITLARQGIGCLVAERRHAPSPWPRATAISTGSMELLRSWGLADAVRARGVDAEWRYWQCDSLASAASGTPYPTGMPTREQSAVISPAAPACVAQNDLEAVLLAHLRTLPAARLHAGTEITAIEDEPGGVTAVLRDVDTGATRAVRARYLVAADGAHSSVRAALGIPMRGPDHLAERISVLFRAPLWPVVGAHRYGIYGVARPTAVNVFLPAGRDDRWLFAIDWDPRRERLADYSEEVFAALIRQGAGVPDLNPRFERIGAVSYAAQLADRFRALSTFLIGDAAHRVSPRGGTGMNTAIADGADLGWKLAWVLRGWAGPALLDSYERERRPVAEHNVARSAAPDGSLRDADQELPADLGGRLAHHWVARGADRRVSTLDLLGPGLTLLTGPDGAAAWAGAARTSPGGAPLAVHALDAVTARALGLHPDGALLARPDGRPVGWWAHAPGAAAASVLDAAVELLVAGSRAARAA
jgi:2-polyprenyl-6-methoxyphenol hydroxylase-like FAD-dependent oxidoreductase